MKKQCKSVDQGGCGRERPEKEFRRSRWGGLHTFCKECEARRALERKHTEINKEKTDAENWAFLYKPWMTR